MTGINHVDWAVADPMDICDLDYFPACCKAGSFTAARDAIKLRQSKDGAAASQWISYYALRIQRPGRPRTAERGLHHYLRSLNEGTRQISRTLNEDTRQTSSKLLRTGVGPPGERVKQDGRGGGHPAVRTDDRGQSPAQSGVINGNGTQTREHLAADG